MSFATLVSLLLQLGPMLPAFLTFIETVMAAWKQLPSLPSHQAVAAKLSALSLTDADHSEFVRVADMAERHRHELKLGGGNFDAHRVINVGKWLIAHEGMAAQILAMFGIQIPQLPPPVNPPAPPTTA